jgi:hypothetical protein
MNYKDHKRLKNTVNKYMADIRPDRLTTCQSERKSVVSRRPSVFHCTVLYCTLYRRATRHVVKRDAKCIDVDGAIFGNVLYWVNCTNFVTCIVNTGIRNST